MYEVHVFEAEATATVANTDVYLPGARHGVLVFSRQLVRTEHDWVQAETGLSQAGWSAVSFQRAGTLSAESLNGKSEQFASAFEHAMLGGCGVVVYREPSRQGNTNAQ